MIRAKPDEMVQWEKREMLNVAHDYDGGFITNIKASRGYEQESGKDMKNVKKDEKTVAQIYTGRGEEKTLCAFPKWTSWSSLPLVLLEEATKTSRLLGDRNKSKVVDSAIRVG